MGAKTVGSLCLRGTNSAVAWQRGACGEGQGVLGLCVQPTWPEAPASAASLTRGMSVGRSCCWSLSAENHPETRKENVTGYERDCSLLIETVLKEGNS